MKIATIVGARPQFIKCAPLSREIRKEHQEIIIHTGQHYDYEMSKVFFDELEIPKPDYNLNVGSGSQGHQTGAILSAIEDVLVKERPHIVVTFGDTNSTLAGALAAAKLSIPVAHVEAGVRSFDRAMPEEINRVLTDHISAMLFAPTNGAVHNLSEEGIRRGVYKIGDVMVDSLYSVKEVALKKSDVMSRLGLKRHGYYALTMHRAGNTDDPAKLKKILRAIGGAGVQVVFPAHPRTLKLLNEAHYTDNPPNNIMIIDPLGYMDMIALIANARGVLTDSGGIQKESFILGTRCITMRENTEWPETFMEGRNRLVGLDEGKIVNALELPALGNAPHTCPFGPVGACQRIVNMMNVQ